ncbi:uncharacterized protein CDV56_105922 [Aspergillus thermomutatus]|uniref:Uncharacterized protein n=1 Tax=Aspergillus thermomutatus TaxID=41047 RepID=A0A397GM38_ASPTH|nr:uncharacterized protein CDV56_105922 [Aspergillus thermomutatus]RHZ50604.1 hypothetical protein CDV56_105922 [Aspergillus thermomutatus]
MGDSENSDFAGWNQVFTSNLTLLNQIHKTIWKVEHGRKGIQWSSNAVTKITGVQKEAGTFSAGFPKDYLWYTVTLREGTFGDVKIDEWHVQFPVYFAKYQLSDEEVAAHAAILEDGELTDLISWGLTIKLAPAYLESDWNCPTFDPTATQPPSPSEIEHQKGWAKGQVAFDLARWFWPSTDHTPRDAGPLGLILKLVPDHKVSDERYRFGPTGFDCQIDPENGLLLLQIMTQNRPLPSTTPTLSSRPALKDYAGKLCVSKEEFWDGWFLQKYRQVAYDTQIWPIIPDQWDIGYNPDHPDIDSEYYNFTRDVFGSYQWETALPEGLPSYEEHYVDQNLTVQFVKGNIRLGAFIGVRLEDGGKSYSWVWDAYFWVTEMDTDDGGLQVKIGPVMWARHPENDTPDWCKKIYAAMDNVVTSTVTSQMAKLAGLSNLHRFFVPGYDNFKAQDPEFSTADLYVDLFMNGQQPLSARLPTMATVTQDAELMTTYRAAVPVVAGGKFLAFRDGSLHPALVSQGEDGYFVFFNLPDSIVDFELRQYDDKTSFVFSTWASDDTCGIHLFHSLTADELSAPPKSKTFHGTVSKPKQLFLSEIVDDDSLPSLFISCARPGRPDEVVLRPVMANQSDHSLRSNDDWALRGNITDILAVTVGVTEFGKGVFVLYNSHEEQKRFLQFRNDVADGVDQFPVDFPVHPKATCLATYNNPETDYSALILAGEEISLYVDKQYLTHAAKPTATVPGPLGVTSIHVSQKDDQLSIWYTNDVEAAYYYNTTHRHFADGEAIQFLPGHAGRTVSGMLWEHTEQQTLVQTLTTTNDDGLFTVWQQTQTTGYWDEQPFHVDAPAEATPTDAFVIRLQAQNPADPSIVHRCQMQVTTADLLQCYCNGKSSVIGPVASWHQADENGVLNIVIPTSKITCGNVNVTALRPSNGGGSIPISTGPLRPSSKVLMKLNALQTGQDILNAKTQLGRPLVSPGSLTLERAEEIALALSKLQEAAVNFATQESASIGPLAAARRPPVGKFGWFRNLWNKVVGWGHKAIHQIKVWVEKVDEMIPNGPWKIVFHFFEEPVEILLDGFDAVLIAMDFVMNLLQTAWDLAWFDSGFDWAAEKIDDLDHLVDNYCQELSNRVKHVPTIDSVSMKSVTDGANPQVTELQNSVKYDWEFNILLYGADGDSFSGASLSADAIHPGDVGNMSAVGDAYELIKKLLKDVQGTLQDIFGDVTQWFSTDMSITEIFKRLGADLLDGIVHVAADLAHALLKAIKGSPRCTAGQIKSCKLLTKAAPPDLTSLTKDSWNNHISHGPSASSTILAVDATALTYFGNLLSMVSSDVSGLANGVVSGLDVVKAAAAFDIIPNVNLFDLIKLVVKFITKVPPWSTPWAESRMTTEYCLVYGVGIVDYVLLGICMGARAGTGVPHDDMSYFSSAGAVSCTTLTLALRVIIGVDELDYAEKFAIFHFVEAGL